MKTTVEISDALFKQVKSLAHKEGLSFRILVEEGLRTVVQKRSRSESKPFRLRDGSFSAGKGLQSGADWKDLTEVAYDTESRFDKPGSR